MSTSRIIFLIPQPGFPPIDNKQMAEVERRITAALQSNESAAFVLPRGWDWEESSPEPSILDQE